LSRCANCQKSESDHGSQDHLFERNAEIPEWHGWHAARRGLGSNLYRLGVPEKTIQRILRHANVSTTSNYYIKTADDDVQEAMAKLENQIVESGLTESDTNRPPQTEPPVSALPTQ
jgi:integrase